MSTNQPSDDGLAYGQEGGSRAQGEGDAGAERGFFGDTFKKIKNTYDTKPTGSGSAQQSGGFGASLFKTVHGAVHDVGRQVNQRLVRRETHSHTHADSQCDHGTHENCQHRHSSFAPQRQGNNIKWYVDGCGYMWAVSRALEQATQTIWILDCMSRYTTYGTNLLNIYRVALARTLPPTTSCKK